VPRLTKHAQIDQLILFLGGSSRCPRLINIWASGSENPDCPRQVIGRVPVIERRAVGLIGHFGAHHEVSFPHQSFPPACRKRLFTRLGAPLLNIESSDLTMAA
jgi:hypothetical protein